MLSDYSQLQRTANILRFEVIRMISRAKSCHVGSCLSVMDILVALYGGGILNFSAKNPTERDRCILSKGHAAAALYTVLAQYDFFPQERLKEYLVDESAFIAHTNSYGIPGIEFSTGSLGHGLPLSCGIALSGALLGKGYRVFAILSEGDCEEGSTWEAALFAAHHKLSNLICIIDRNQIQNYGRVSDICELEPLEEKWRSFGWGAQSVNGHDMEELLTALNTIPFQHDRPSVIIAQTVKGKGVSFMEDQLKWHYQTPSPEEVELAHKELMGED